MANNRVQPQQYFEYRYFIREEVGPYLRDFIGAYVRLDEHAVGRPDYAYPIDDFYYDSEQWRIYWRLIDVAAQSLQARLRFYSHRPDAPVYCETKRRVNDRVEKHRAAVAQAALPWLVAGQLPEPAALPAPPEDQAHFGVLLPVPG
jgi:hypothetical protein